MFPRKKIWLATSLEKKNLGGNHHQEKKVWLANWWTPYIVKKILVGKRSVEKNLGGKCFGEKNWLGLCVEKKNLVDGGPLCGPPHRI